MIPYQLEEILELFEMMKESTCRFTYHRSEFDLCTISCDHFLDPNMIVYNIPLDQKKKGYVLLSERSNLMIDISQFSKLIKDLLNIVKKTDI